MAKKNEMIPPKTFSSAAKEEWSLYLNKKGAIEYNKKCARCSQECKQSFRVDFVQCPKFEDAYRKKKSST